MDWFTWLSKTGLEPSLVYEYGLAFAHNELEEEDIAYLNHEFLQSMGISIAKHRLEILKLARREKSSSYTLKHPVSKLLLVLKKTKKSLANCIATLVHRDNDNRSLIVVPNKMRKKKAKVGAISYSSRWKKAMMMRNSKKLVTVGAGNQEMLMLTNGDYYGDVVGDDPLVVSTPRLDSFSSPLMYDLHQNKEEKFHDDQDDDEHWSPALEEISLQMSNAAAHSNVGLAYFLKLVRSSGSARTEKEE